MDSQNKKKKRKAMHVYKQGGKKYATKSDLKTIYVATQESWESSSV